ncbi:MAG: TIGR04013 family B12-binding domain/radical SAM domain-containing protein, partial [Planctomycetota bacterium]|nr:TIGR04013 family B12-binding domain/radical SAM domain-containing protein [Planctomycetota bacterium]
GTCHVEAVSRVSSSFLHFGEEGPLVPSGTIFFSGCNFACAFCQTSHLLGARPRHRSVEQLVKHVETMRRNGLRDVRLLSPDAFSYGSPDGKQLNLAALDALLAGLRRVLGQDGRLFVGSFPSEARPEHVTAETLGLVRRYANNDKIVIGAQSGSERTLELCHRGHNVDDVLSAVTLTLKAGLQANVDFILGLPGETDDDMDRTAAAIEKLAAMGARIHAHYFMPLPQTGFAGRRPSRLSRRLEKTVNRLVGRGHVYGEWQAQEKVARWLVGEG